MSSLLLFPLHSSPFPRERLSAGSISASGCRAAFPKAAVADPQGRNAPAKRRPSVLDQAAVPTAAFSLIEVALSIAIIGVGLVAILGVMPSLLTSSRGAVENTEIAMAAQNSVDMDFAALRTPADLNGFSGLHFEPCIGPSLRATNCIAYSAATNSLSDVEFKDANGLPLLRTVRYTYSWPPGAARPQVFTFVTEICATTNIVMR